MYNIILHLINSWLSNYWTMWILFWASAVRQTTGSCQNYCCGLFGDRLKTEKLPLRVKLLYPPSLINNTRRMKFISHSMDSRFSGWLGFLWCTTTNKKSLSKDVNCLGNYLWVSILENGKFSDFHTRQNGITSGLCFLNSCKLVSHIGLLLTYIAEQLWNVSISVLHIQFYSTMW